MIIRIVNNRCYVMGFICIQLNWYNHDRPKAVPPMPSFRSIDSKIVRGNFYTVKIPLLLIWGLAPTNMLITYHSNITSIYEVIGSRFGVPLQKTASGIFLITRLFADGVRFLATAVVVQAVTGWPVWIAVLVIGLVTTVYTLSGGIRTVLWVDSFQFVLYLVGGAIVILFILNSFNLFFYFFF